MVYKITYQSLLGHAIRCDEALQIKRQLQGHLTYFLPGGAAFIGLKKERKLPLVNN